MGEGHPQASVAKLMGLSTATINGYTKSFESWGLIRRQVPKLQSEKGKRQRTIFYELTEETQLRLGGVRLPQTECRVHHIGVKYRISQSRSPSKDERTGYDHSFYMRGGSERKVYWFSGRNGLPSVTVTWHPGTLIVWVDRGQKIMAASIEDAERLGDEAIAKAKEKFVTCQGKFGIQIVADNGTMMGKRHYGFLHEDGTEAVKQGVTVKGWWEDKSTAKEIPGSAELETMDKPSAYLLDQTIQFSQQFPDLIKQTISPISTEVSAVKAMVQGGIGLSGQYEQMLNVMTLFMKNQQEQMKEMAALRQEIRDLRAERK